MQEPKPPPRWLASKQLLGHFAPDRRIAPQLVRDRSLQKKIDRCCELLRSSPRPPLTTLTVSPAVLR
jgi:hypothetical protein